MPTSVPHLVDPAVLPLCRALLDRGLMADVRVTFVCGEPDVRLLVCRGGADLYVELLASLACEPAPTHWHAVRVRGDSREVWQGPRYGSSPIEVVNFVDTMLSGRLSGRPGGADGRYTLLG
jgi:hypothetical protein